MNIVFFGSDDFACVHLEALIKSSYKIVGCVTQPDRPKGRGMHVIVSPIKQCAQKHNIPVLQPTDLKDAAFVAQLKEFKSDLFVVIAYGRFLPREVLEIPRLYPINVHGSLLPKYRGAAPINWAILNGDKQAGVSIMLINDVMDSGDFCAQLKIDIEDDDTSITLREKMMQVSPAVLLETVESISQNKCKFQKQDELVVTFAPKLTKDLGFIDWGKTADEICNKVRGLLPWPSAYTFYKGKMLKVLEADIIDEDFSFHAPGTVMNVDKQGIMVAVSDGGILIKKVHFENGKAMDAHSFVIGHGIEVGFKFG